MRPWVHIAAAVAWAVFGVVALWRGWANILALTFALSVAALVETRISAYIASVAAREAQRQADRAEDAS